MAKKVEKLTVGRLLFALRQLPKNIPILVTDYENQVVWDATKAFKVMNSKGNAVELVIQGEFDITSTDDDGPSEEEGPDDSMSASGDDGPQYEDTAYDDDEGYDDVITGVTGRMGSQSRAEIAEFVKQRLNGIEPDCMAEDVQANTKAIIYAEKKDAAPSTPADPA